MVVAAPRLIMRGLVALMLIAFTPLAATRAQTATTAGPCGSDTPYTALVTVHNIASKKGNIRVQLYSDQKEEWLAKGKKLARVDTPVRVERGGSQQICIAVPAPGVYAFVAMHDKNANGKADIFSEGFGFSNNPRLGLGKPDHDKVTVRVDGAQIQLDVELRYVFGGPKKNRRERGRRRG